MLKMPWYGDADPLLSRESLSTMFRFIPTAAFWIDLCNLRNFRRVGSSFTLLGLWLLESRWFWRGLAGSFIRCICSTLLELTWSFIFSRAKSIRPAGCAFSFLYMLFLDELWAFLSRASKDRLFWIMDISWAICTFCFMRYALCSYVRYCSLLASSPLPPV